MAAEPSTSGVPHFPFGGTTVGGKDSKKVTDVLSLDYCIFRTPYEELNVSYRQSQKSLERTALMTAKVAGQIKKKVNDSKEPIPQEALRKHFNMLIKQVQEQKANLQKSMDTTVAYCQKIRYRCEKMLEEFESDENVDEDGLKEEEMEEDNDNGEGTSEPTLPRVSKPEPKDPKDLDKMERFKFARYIAWHLLRCGFIAPAKELVKEMHLEGMVDVEVFERIFSIEQSILSRDTKPCIDWCDFNRNKLRRLGSRMEIVARQQDVITFIERGDILEAVGYVKKNLVPIAKEKFSSDLTKIMGAIACPLEESRIRNPEYHTPERYEKCAEMFIKEAYRLYGLSGMDAFETIVQMGLASSKTPSCHADTETPIDKQTCVVCRPAIFPLAEELPFAHVDNSIILCSATGTVCDDEENIPYLFPSGHVFGGKIIKRLTRKNGKVWDPVHKQLIDPETEVLRLYFL